MTMMGQLQLPRAPADFVEFTASLGWSNLLFASPISLHSDAANTLPLNATRRLSASPASVEDGSDDHEVAAMPLERYAAAVGVPLRLLLATAVACVVALVLAITTCLGSVWVLLRKLALVKWEKQLRWRMGGIVLRMLILFYFSTTSAAVVQLKLYFSGQVPRGDWALMVLAVFVLACHSVGLVILVAHHLHKELQWKRRTDPKLRAVYGGLYEGFTHRNHLFWVLRLTLRQLLVSIVMGAVDDGAQQVISLFVLVVSC